MKRFTSVVLILVLSLFLASAQAADGKVYPIGDEIYSLFDSLFVSAGYVQPSTSRPWTASEARNELSKLDPGRLDENQTALYNRLADMIAEPEKAEHFGVNVELSPEAYFHTNADYATDQVWAYSFNERKPFATLSINASLGSFYTYCELGYGWGRTSNKDESMSLKNLAIEENGIWYGLGAIVPVENGETLVVTRSDVYSRSFLFNFPAITQIEIDVPRRTNIVFAWAHASVGVYKDRKVWGSSRTGNFIFDSHVSAYNYASLKIFGQSFAFDYTLMIPAQTYSNSQGAEKPAEFRRVFAAHRLDWYALKNLSFAMSENIMYRFDTPDLDILNPAGIYHNQTNSILINAIAHLEAQYVPFPGFRLFFQYSLDQATAPTEADTQDSAMGYSGGLSFSRILKKGILNLALEGAYTDSAFYRRNHVDFIIWTNNSTNKPYVRYPIFTYIGFRYGGDTAALRFDADYDMAGGIGLYGNASVIWHGSFGMLDSHNRDHDNTKEPNLRLKAPSGDVTTSVILQCGVTYRTSVFGLPVKAFADIAWIMGETFCGRELGNDLQISVGFSVNTESN
ncbi:MAG: hypothetical protein IJS84_10180 [Spirochaetales bacterium]|nr:hypothetical protein [Spirochaetales bacterium]